MDLDSTVFHGGTVFMRKGHVVCRKSSIYIAYRARISPAYIRAGAFFNGAVRAVVSMIFSSKVLDLCT